MKAFDRFVFWLYSVLGLKTKHMLRLEARKNRNYSESDPFLLKLAQARDEVDNPVLSHSLQVVFDHLVGEEFIKAFRSAHAANHTTFILRKDDADFYRVNSGVGGALSSLEWRHLCYHLSARFSKSGIEFVISDWDRYRFNIKQILDRLESITAIEDPDYPDININSDQAYR